MFLLVLSELKLTGKISKLYAKGSVRITKFTIFADINKRYICCF